MTDEVVKPFLSQVAGRRYKAPNRCVVAFSEQSIYRVDMKILDL
jgi:hypothetical protein